MCLHPAQRPRTGVRLRRIFGRHRRHGLPHPDVRALLHRLRPRSARPPEGGRGHGLLFSHDDRTATSGTVTGAHRPLLPLEQDRPVSTDVARVVHRFCAKPRQEQRPLQAGQHPGVSSEGSQPRRGPGLLRGAPTPRSGSLATITSSRERGAGVGPNGHRRAGEGHAAVLRRLRRLHEVVQVGWGELLDRAEVRSGTLRQGLEPER